MGLGAGMERSWAGQRFPGKVFLFQLSRQELGQAEAAGGGRSPPDAAVPALCWCDTTALLLDSSRSLWVAVNSPVPPVAQQTTWQSGICRHRWGPETLASSEGVWVATRGGRAPPGMRARAAMHHSLSWSSKKQLVV